jgi:hypothetical protein
MLDSDSNCLYMGCDSHGRTVILDSDRIGTVTRVGQYHEVSCKLQGTSDSISSIGLIVRALGQLSIQDFSYNINTLI